MRPTRFPTPLSIRSALLQWRRTSRCLAQGGPTPPCLPSIEDKLQEAREIVPMLARIRRRRADAETPMFDAVWTACLEPLKTRREVRAFLAAGLNDLIGGLGQQDLSAELSGLATASDREVIDSYRRLHAFCSGLSARDAKHAGSLVSLNVRDLFARLLQRMKELPPDPRETLHATPEKPPGVEQPGQTSTPGRGVSQPARSTGRAARNHAKAARGASSRRR